ncbi:septum site-determining protein MinC [Thiorhodovibrio frisius]|uniref:Probable septum site-determining protein MinC n=1 Tax=Thiorhodovibrio frisius TaxID=631362 RepID=H8Z4E8_9GAMM|nr:septum site-determining protein MinC [Thiorhodovibrio frisius]EIC20205.1 septum site-determining protein MinC [Thiorhodovibrio frisius]WPL20943.1 Septum site-determining protein MinC [Thiorhodovibrio frisius]
METESEQNGSQNVLEIKAASFTLPVIRVLRVDMNEIADEITAKVEQAPDFFRHAPVVIDLTGLDDPAAEINFPQLVGMLRGYGMLPIGLRGGSPEQQSAARAMELVLMSDGGHRRMHQIPVNDESNAQAHKQAENRQAGENAAHENPDQDEAAQTESSQSESRTGDTAVEGVGIEFGSTLINRPVRSGQKVYAAGGDLTVTAAVNSGAELMADGNIHIYGPLRGRVFAGIKGDTRARIFCQDLQAELVAVAGHYRVSENIPANLKNARVQIYLDQDTLRIEPF